MHIVRRLVVCTLVAAVAAFPRVVSAQEAAGPWSAGLLAGLDVADLSGDDKDLAPHDRFGFIGGGFVRLGLSEHLSLELDLLYVPKGGEENTDDDPSDPEDQFKVEYVEVPLLLRVALGGSAVSPELFAGPSVGFEVDCTYDAFPNGESDPRPCSDLGIETRSVDVGVAFGAAVDVPLGAGWLVIDGRGIVGLRSIDDSEADLDIRNRILALMVGYRLPM